MGKKTGLGLVFGAGLGILVGAIGLITIPVALPLGVVLGLLIGSMSGNKLER